MAVVRWIKIVTDIFDDEKILMIESLPEADSIIVIWFKLLCLAGKQNNSGVFMLNSRIPYTEEMFATIFRRPINTVRLALATFEQYGMIEIVNHVVTIPNWGKHQDLDQIEARTQYMRNYMQEYRRKQKLLAAEEGGETGRKANSKANSKPNVSEADIDIDKDKDKSKNNTVCAEQSSDSSAPAEKAPALFSLPLNDGTFYDVTQADVDTYKTLYPAVDVEQEIRKMIGWLDANPPKRKTRRGIKNFINSWLCREQDKGGVNRPTYSTPREPAKIPQQPMTGNPWKR